jgi:hypothetical protein
LLSLAGYCILSHLNKSIQTRRSIDDSLDRYVMTFPHLTIAVEIQQVNQ